MSRCPPMWRQGSYANSLRCRSSPQQIAAVLAKSPREAALLDFLRKGGKTSELAPERTVQKTSALLAADRRLERMLKLAESEPPRLRASLCPRAPELGPDTGARPRLRASLNPL